MIVFVPNFIHPLCLQRLKENVTVVDTLDDIEHIDAMLIRGFEVPAELIEKAKNLKLVARHGVGYNNVDTKAAAAHGVAVTNTPAANSDSVAELAVGLAIAAARNIIASDKGCRNGAFKKTSPAEMKGHQIHGKTLGQIAIGNIGSRVGKIMKNAFDMKVIAYDPYVPAERFEELGFERTDSLEYLIKNSDVVNISALKNKETTDMIHGEMFNWFKPGAVLVNAARGGIVNETDLYNALKDGRLAAAACDSFVVEPPDKNNPLFTLDNFTATPHNGANTEEALINMGMMAVDEVLRLKNGEPFKNKVN